MVQQPAEHDHRQQALADPLAPPESRHAEQRAEEHELLHLIHHVRGAPRAASAQEVIEASLPAEAELDLIEPQRAEARLVPLAVQLFPEKAQGVRGRGFEFRHPHGEELLRLRGRGGGVFPAVGKCLDRVLLAVPAGGRVALVKAHGHPRDHGDPLPERELRAALVQLLRELGENQHAHGGKPQTEQRAQRGLFRKLHQPDAADGDAEDQQVELQRYGKTQKQGRQQRIPDAPPVQKQQEHPYPDNAAGEGRDIAVEKRDRQQRLQAEKEQQHRQLLDPIPVKEQAADLDQRMPGEQQPQQVDPLQGEPAVALGHIAEQKTGGAEEQLRIQHIAELEREAAEIRLAERRPVAQGRAARGVGDQIGVAVNGGLQLGGRDESRAEQKSPEKQHALHAPQGEGTAAPVKQVEHAEIDQGEDAVEEDVVLPEVDMLPRGVVRVQACRLREGGKNERQQKTAEQHQDQHRRGLFQVPREAAPAPVLHADAPSLYATGSVYTRRVRL